MFPILPFNHGDNDLTWSTSMAVVLLWAEVSEMKMNWGVSYEEAFIRLQNNGCWCWCLLAEDVIVIVLRYYVKHRKLLLSGVNIKF